MVTSFSPFVFAVLLSQVQNSNKGEQLCYLSVNDLYLIFYSFREWNFFPFVILAICVWGEPVNNRVRFVSCLLFANTHHSHLISSTSCIHGAETPNSYFIFGITTIAVKVFKTHLSTYQKVSLHCQNAVWLLSFCIYLTR